MEEVKAAVARMGVGLDEYAKSEVYPEETSPRQKMAELAKLMFDRNLTDASGGNISCRIGDRVYVTPRYLGEVDRLRLNVDKVVAMGLDAKVIDGDPNWVTREGSIHLGIYNAYPQVRGVIHAHPRNIIPFSAVGISVPANTEMFKHLLGTDSVEACSEVGPATDALSATVRDTFARRMSSLNHYGAAVMIPNHGLIVAARNLDYAYAILEAVDTSAYIYLQTMLLKNLSTLHSAWQSR